MPMTRQQLILTKIAEEATEVAKEALKCQQFGFDDTKPNQPQSNRQRLAAELIDLMAMLKLADNECGQIGSAQDYILGIAAKHEKFEKYYQRSIELGYVESPLANPHIYSGPIVYPTHYTEHDGGRWLPWGTDSGLRVAWLKEQVAWHKEYANTTFRYGPRSIHSIAFANPFGKGDGEFPCWDCINGWTTPIEES